MDDHPWEIFSHAEEVRWALASSTLRLIWNFQMIFSHPIQTHHLDGSLSLPVWMMYTAQRAHCEIWTFYVVLRPALDSVRCLFHIWRWEEWLRFRSQLFTHSFDACATDVVNDSPHNIPSRKKNATRTKCTHIQVHLWKVNTGKDGMHLYITRFPNKLLLQPEINFSLCMTSSPCEWHHFLSTYLVLWQQVKNTIC